MAQHLQCVLFLPLRVVSSPGVIIYQTVTYVEPAAPDSCHSNSTVSTHTRLPSLLIVYLSVLAFGKMSQPAFRLKTD